MLDETFRIDTSNSLKRESLHFDSIVFVLILCWFGWKLITMGGNFIDSSEISFLASFVIIFLIDCCKKIFVQHFISKHCFMMHHRSWNERMIADCNHLFQQLSKKLFPLEIINMHTKYGSETINEKNSKLKH